MEAVAGFRLPQHQGGWSCGQRSTAHEVIHLLTEDGTRRVKVKH